MNTLTRCMQEIQLQVAHMNEFTTRRRVVTVNEHEAVCVEYDVAKEPVSIHQPLWRFCAALFAAPADILRNYVCEDDPHKPDFALPRLTGDAAAVKAEGSRRSLKGFRTVLMEMPLR